VIGSEVEVYNLALNAIGGRNNISSPTENSREAEVCNLWYSAVRDQVLAAAPWPEASKLEYLALAAKADDSWSPGEPRPGYEYAYTMPIDCIRPQYLTTFSRFLITAGPNDTILLHTNESQALLMYTFNQAVVTLWSRELQMAIVYGLAAHICMPLTGKPSRTQMLVDRANSIIIAARESSANTSDDRYETVPDWLTARGYADTSSRSAFYYPFGALLNVN
jgi:hypothetical protein